MINTIIRIGLNIVEVAHDIQQQVSKYIVDVMGFVNSYDTWHGMLLWLHEVCVCSMMYNVLL